MKKRGKSIFSLIAGLLERPSDAIAGQACRAADILGRSNREAGEHLDRFREFCLTNRLERLQEIYRSTFSRNARCCPYVGHHLLSMDRTRSLFAAKLKEEYTNRVATKEMPDHISVMLRSLAVQESVEEAREMIICCLIPALRKMIALTDRGNPYHAVLTAVLLALETEERSRAVGVQDEVYAMAGD